MIDPILLIIAVVGLLIVALVWRYDNLGLYLFFSLSFTQCVIEEIGYPPILLKAAGASIVVILLAKAIVFTGRTNRHFRTFGLKMMLFLLAVSVLSALYNAVPLVAFALYFRVVFIHYLLFTAVLNLDFSEKKVNNLLTFWILIQIPVILIKFVIVGVGESYIGTLSLEAGSVSAIFPLAVNCLLLAHYLFKRNPKYLLLAFGFLLFGIIGAKVSLLFSMPLVLLSVLGFYIITSPKIHLQVRPVKDLLPLYPVAVIVLAVICSLAAVVSIPTLNPEGEVGGSIDISHVKDHVTGYATRYSSVTQGNVSRYYGLIDTVELMNSSGVRNYLGFGPGDIIESRFLPGNVDALWSRYGLGYGARTTLVYAWVQTGMISVIIYWAFQITLARKVYGFYKRSLDPQYVILAFGFLGVILVAALDYFAYSKVMFEEAFLAGPYYYIAAVLLKASYRSSIEV